MILIQPGVLCIAPVTREVAPVEPDEVGRDTHHFSLPLDRGKQLTHLKGHSHHSKDSRPSILRCQCLRRASFLRQAHRLEKASFVGGKSHRCLGGKSGLRAKLILKASGRPPPSPLHSDGGTPAARNPVPAFLRIIFPRRLTLRAPVLSPLFTVVGH